MTAPAPDDGLLALLRRTVRAHVVEALLVGLAALAWIFALLWAGDPTVSMATMPGGPRDDIDGRIVSALLEVHDGAWRVRESDVVIEPTRGRKEIEIAFASDEGHLFPWPREGVWAPGGPLLRGRYPDWSVTSRYRLHRRDGVPAFSADDVVERCTGWRGPGRFVGGMLWTPVIASGFNPYGPTGGYPVAGGSVLHVTALLPEDGPDPARVETWRELVAAEARRLVEDVGRISRAEDRWDWWSRHGFDAVHAAALAAMLGVEGAREPLAALRRDLERARDGAWIGPEDMADVLDAVVALLDTGREAPPDEDGVTALLVRFAARDGAHANLREVYRDHAAAELLGTMQTPRRGRVPTPWEPPLQPNRIPPWWPLGALVVVAAAARGGGDRLRRQDVLAFGLAALVACCALDVLPHVSAESPGLMALALLVAQLRRRGALAVPPGVVHAFAAGALLLPLGSVTRLPVIDAAGRVAAFAAFAWLALGPFAAVADDDERPRRPRRRRDEAWTAIQLLAATGCVLALLLAILDPTAWAKRPPRPRWILVGVGLVLTLSAGIVAFLRERPRRPLPAATVAVAIGAGVHLTFLPLSPFPRGELSAQGDLGRLGMLAAAAVVVLAVGRLAAHARSARTSPP